MKIVKLSLVIFTLLFSHALWAKNNISVEILSGFYTSAECDIGIFINKKEEEFTYQLVNSSRKRVKGKITLEGDSILFNNLYRTFTGDENNVEEPSQVGGLFENNSSFIIQNYGNSMNPYIVFDACDKYLKYEYNATSIAPVNSKTYLHKVPNKPTKMYLIKGDKVTLLDEKIDDAEQKWYFINYKGKKDLNMWIKAEAIDVEPEIKEEPKPIKQPAPKEPELAPQTKSQTSESIVIAKQELGTTPPKNAETIKTKKAEPIEKSANGSISLTLLASLLGLLAWRVS